MDTQRFVGSLCDMLPLGTKWHIGIFFQCMKSPIGRNAQCWSNFIRHSVYKMPAVIKKFMFQCVYYSLPNSVFDHVSVVRELYLHALRILL